MGTSPVRRRGRYSIAGRANPLLWKSLVERILLLRALILHRSQAQTGSRKLESGGQDNHGGFSLSNSTELLIVNYESKGGRTSGFVYTLTHRNQNDKDIQVAPICWPTHDPYAESPCELLLTISRGPVQSWQVGPSNADNRCRPIYTRLVQDHRVEEKILMASNARKQRE